MLIIEFLFKSGESRTVTFEIVAFDNSEEFLEKLNGLGYLYGFDQKTRSRVRISLDDVSFIRAIPVG